MIVTKYYDPFGSSFDCADAAGPAGERRRPRRATASGRTPARTTRTQKIKEKIRPLRVELDRMNAVLEQGAQGFGFSVVQPRFDGHELCSDEPWVQGMTDPAPFHPTGGGRAGDHRGDPAAAAGLTPPAPA